MVEISPVDHGTTALECFFKDSMNNNSSTSASVLDSRLIHTLRRTMGPNIKPTAIQSNAIPLLLNGYDVMASSPTGSGKSLMFGLPLLQRLLQTSTVRNNNSNNNIGAPASLIISPTRELAIQTSAVLKSFVNSNNNNKKTLLNVCLATGGADVKSQRQQLPSCDVLVGTPGRIIQFIDERKLSLSNIEYLVIDEADRLLDMGFEPQLTRIGRSLRYNEQKSILCSATLKAQRLASDFLKSNYYFVSVGKVGGTHSNIKQRFEWVNTNFYYDNNN